MNNLTPEQTSLLHLSRQVWKNLEDAKALGVPFNEETITETTLLDLSRGYPGDVRIIAFNKHEEAKTGADWLWSFVSFDESQSQTMLIQAKRLHESKDVYQSIFSKIGKRTPAVLQIDQLINTAQRLKVPALYAFYNYVTNKTRIPHKWCRSLNFKDPNHFYGFGISVANASIVRSKYADKTFDTHIKHSIPLHCLLCNGGSSIRPKGGTPAMVVSGLARLGIAASLEGRDSDDDSVLQMGLHPTVKKVLELAQRSDPDDGHDIPAPDDLPGIAGVVVLRDTNQD